MTAYIELEISPNIVPPMLGFDWQEECAPTSDFNPQSNSTL
jgi:hypothetical protein